ncbi:hypothetical protein ACU686_38960 [Yinghuangia aomiensis]
MGRARDVVAVAAPASAAVSPALAAAAFEPPLPSASGVAAAGVPWFVTALGVCGLRRLRPEPLLRGRRRSPRATSLRARRRRGRFGVDGTRGGFRTHVRTAAALGVGIHVRSTPRGCDRRRTLPARCGITRGGRGHRGLVRRGRRARAVVGVR